MGTTRRTTLLACAIVFLLGACAADGAIEDAEGDNNERPPWENNGAATNNSTSTNNTTSPNNTSGNNTTTPTNNSSSTNNTTPTNNSTPTNNNTSTNNGPGTPVPVPELIPAYPHAEGSLSEDIVDGGAVEAPAAGDTCAEWSSIDGWRVETTFGEHGPLEVVDLLEGGAEKRTETWTYDSAGNVIARVEVDQDGVVLRDEAWTYDAAGHAVGYERSVREESGNTATSSWRRTIQGGVPVQEVYSEGGQEVETTFFVYREDGTVREEYPADPATGADWIWRYTYDTFGRLLRAESSDAAYGGSVADPWTVQRSYDVAGRLVEIAYDDAPQLYRRFTWVDGRPVRVEAATYGHEIEVTASWSGFMGALRSKEGTVDDQLFPTTWSYEGAGCRTSPMDLSADVDFLHIQAL